MSRVILIALPCLSAILSTYSSILQKMMSRWDYVSHVVQSSYQCLGVVERYRFLCNGVLYRRGPACYFLLWEVYFERSGLD